MTDQLDAVAQAIFTQDMASEPTYRGDFTTLHEEDQDHYRRMAEAAINTLGLNPGGGDEITDHLNSVAAHRPYGLDCKCGRPINSDEDWARHLIDALGLTEEREDRWVEGDEPCHCGSGNKRGHDEPHTRLVSPWARERGDD